MVSVLFASPVTGQVGTMRFSRIPDEAGLSHRSVNVITQDHEGFLWVGTAGGLNRYDGYGFEVFRPDPGDSTTISSNLIWDVIEDGEQRLWILGDDGVDRYDRARDRFFRHESFRVSEEGKVFGGRLHIDAGGRVWVLLPDRMYVLLDSGFVAADEVYPHLAETGRVPHALVDGPHGELWGVSVDQRVSTIPGARPRGRLGDDFGNFFHRIDGSGRWLVPNPPVMLAGDTVAYTRFWYRAVRVDDRVWLTTDEGLRELAPDGSVGPVVRLAPRADDFVFNFATAVYVDRSGTLWIGSLGGLYRHDPHAKPFQLLDETARPSGGLSGLAVSAVARAGEVLWVGTFGSGLRRIELDGGRSTVFRNDPADPQSLPSDVVWSIETDESGRMWVGTDAGLAMFSPASGRFDPIDGASTGAVKMVVADGVGDLWLAAARGLLRYSPTSGALDRFPCCGRGRGPSHTVVESIAADDEVVWIGSGANYLDRFDRDTGIFSSTRFVDDSGEPVGGLAIWDLHVAGDGRVWAGTGAGLASFDPGSGTLSVVGGSGGLPGNVVFSIEEDPQGRLWLGTNQGISRYDPDDDGHRVRNYGLADGISALEFNRHASFADPGGEFWFGSMNGLTRFRPERVLDNPVAPPVVMTRVETSGPEGTRRLNDERGGPSLDYAENSVAFEFSALNFTNAEQNRYRYRLDPADPDWVESSARSARYAGLAPGRYTFSVYGSNNDGVWSPEPATFRFSVAPPFWATWWFRVSVFALLLAAAGVAYRLRVAHLLTVERVRLQIAGDLHDDLASELSGMALMAEALQDRLPTDAQGRSDLASLTASAQQLMHDVRDIVWAVDPGHSRLEDLVHRMRAVTTTLLHETPYTFELRGERGSEVDLPMEFRRQLLLVLKEALHNVVRHAMASSVRVGIEMGRGVLVLEVEDDGVGFDATGEGHRFGLRQMERRTERLGGNLTLETAPGHGTRVRITVPVP